MHNRIKNLRAILFDVHRTLVDDSGFPREKIWRLLQTERIALGIHDYYQYYDTLTHRLFDWRKINPFIKVREIHRKRLYSFYTKYKLSRNIESDLSYLYQSMSECKIYPEVEHVLRRIRQKYRVALLSNADNDDPLIQILLNNGFCFDTIVTSESVRVYKPHALIFTKTLERMGLDKDQVLLVGDSQISDVLGGKSFGIRVVWVNRSGQTLKRGIPKPDFEIEDLTQLLDVLDV